MDDDGWLWDGWLWDEILSTFLPSTISSSISSSTILVSSLISFLDRYGLIAVNEKGEGAQVEKVRKNNEKWEDDGWWDEKWLIWWSQNWDDIFGLIKPSHNSSHNLPSHNSSHNLPSYLSHNQPCHLIRWLMKLLQDYYNIWVRWDGRWDEIVDEMVDESLDEMVDDEMVDYEITFSYIPLSYHLSSLIHLKHRKHKGSWN